MTFYTDEWQYYPGSIAQGQGYYLWPERLLPEVAGNRDVFLCPNLPSQYAASSDQVINRQPFRVYTGATFSYGYNDWGTLNVARNVGTPGGLGLGGDVHPDNTANYVKATQIRRPAEMITLGESTTDNSFDGTVSPTNRREGPSARHGQSGFYLFADGHAELARLEQATNVYNVNEPLWNMRWNNDNKFHMPTERQ
jgi:prepilin-type processing-associated H-X9-DG protein